MKGMDFGVIMSEGLKRTRRYHMYICTYMYIMSTSVYIICRYMCTLAL